MPWFTYLLRCEDGSLYAGITTALSRRLQEHQGGGKKAAKYTRHNPGLRFEAAWQSENRAAASRLEYRLKRLTRGEKERLIAGTAPEGLELDGYTRVDMEKTEPYPCADKTVI